MNIVRGKHFSEPPVVRTTCGGAAVKSFGFTNIIHCPPDLLPQSTMQEGNENPVKKLTLKDSDEIASNYIGVSATRMPRTSDNDYLPLEPANLIDGNPESCWMSKTQPRSNMNPVWIRIDFPVECNISRIVLRKRPLNPNRLIMEGWWGPEDGAVEVGRGMPAQLQITASTDCCHWETLFCGETGDDESKESFEISGLATRAKAIWITGTQLPKVENLMYCFSIASIEVLDENGSNAALLSRGAGVETNSTTHSMGETTDIHRNLHPMHYDLGVKWVRVGYHDDVLNWHWVEKEKGVLKIDPYADAVITEMYDNGVNVVLCLDYGNKLYTDRLRREMPQLWEWNYEPPKPPTTKEALEAWGNYYRYMVRRFKDRITYFEVWNEWNGSGYWGDVPNCEDYLALAEIAVGIIREEAPQAKVILGSYAGFVSGISTWTGSRLSEESKNHPFLKVIGQMAKKVDFIGYHPFYNTDPCSDSWKTYPEDIDAFNTYCKSCGFAGGYIVSEYNYGCCVPPYEGNMWWGTFTCTELQKAKYITRLIALNTEHNIGSYFCESFNSTHPLDLSLFRRTITQEPYDAVQPQAAYFVMRNLCSYLDGVHGGKAALAVKGVNFDTHHCRLERNGEDIVSVWASGLAKDISDSAVVTLVMDGSAEEVSAFDPVNGVEQRLEYIETDGHIEIHNFLIKDYPVFVRVKR